MPSGFLSGSPLLFLLAQTVFSVTLFFVRSAMARPNFSLVTDGYSRSLHTFARLPYEPYATGWAEYCHQKLWFTHRKWAVSSQQPPSRLLLTDRRVDLKVEELGSHGPPRTILFLEAKHHGVEQSEVVKCHGQAVDAAEFYTQNLPPAEAHPVWLVMWIGTTLRIEIYYPDYGDTIPFLPGYFRLMNVEEDYIETDSNYGRDIMAAFSHIVNNPVPSQDWLTNSPKLSTSTISMPSTPHPLSPSSIGRQKLADAAAASGSRIPLHSSEWTQVYIVEKSPQGLIGRYISGNGYDFDTRTFPNEWQAERRDIRGQEIDCWTIIGDDRRVWYTLSLEPAEEEQGKGKGNAEAGPSSYAHDPAGTVPSYVQDEGNDEGESEEEAAQPSSKRTREWHEVRATKIPHHFSPDEIKFKDENGKSILTAFKEWKWKNHGGAPAFAWRHPRTRKFYFTRQEPS